MSNQSADAAQAGRGVLFIAFAKFYFMIAGAVIEFVLPAVLSVATFGAYGVIASTVSPLNNVLITGTIQGVSRFTAQTPDQAREIQRAGFRMQTRIGVPIAIVFVALAPVLAWFFHDTSKTGPLMLSGAIVLAYAFYAVFVGTANGLRRFGTQAALDVTMATMRAGGIVGLAIAGFGLYGAIGGWVGAAGIIVVVAAFAVGLPGRSQGDRMSLAPLTRFFSSVALYLILLNLIMFADQLLLKRLTSEWFSDHASGLKAQLLAVTPSWLAADAVELADPSKLADVQVGYYRAVQNLARLSYQAIIAVTFVIFPLVSRSTFVSDTDKTKAYVQTTLRYSLIFAGSIAVVFAANPRQLLDIPYASTYAEFGAPALVSLALGNVCFAVFAIGGTILNGAGLTRQAIAVAAITLVVAVVANAIVIPRFTPGRDVLLAAASATAAAMFVGAVTVGWLLQRKLGAFLPALSVVRIAAAAGIAIAVGRVLSFRGAVMVLAESVVVGLVFLMCLIGLRELKVADLRAIVTLGRSTGGRR